MSTIPALDAGLAGIQRGLADAQEKAAKIANSATADGASDITEPLVGLMMDKLQVQASVKVVETVSEMMGTLLDVTA